MAYPKIGILTVSDRASRGEYEDLGGPAIREYLEEVLRTPFEALARMVADEVGEIEGALTELVDVDGCSLVITTGGTGPSPRDVTPEATVAACEKLLPGFGEEMRRVSVAKVPTAILSRQTAGIRGHALLLNLPGSPKAIRECLDAVFAAIPHAIEQAGGPRLETDPERVKASRPHGR